LDTTKQNIATKVAQQQLKGMKITKAALKQKAQENISDQDQHAYHQQLESLNIEIHQTGKPQNFYIQHTNQEVFKISSPLLSNKTEKPSELPQLQKPAPAVQATQVTKPASAAPAVTVDEPAANSHTRKSNKQRSARSDSRGPLPYTAPSAAKIQALLKMIIFVICLQCYTI